MKYIYKLLMLDKAERLKIAFVTDIHLNKAGIEKLSDWAIGHYNNESKFDYCFIGGDTANCDHDKMNHDEEQNWKSTLETHKFIKDIFSCKVFFVPGNHDCKHFFHPSCKTQDFYNMHGKCLELATGLKLVGFGGSPPGYMQGKLFWEGYPYKSNKQLELEWQKTGLNQALNQQQNNQIIMLTHVGPSISETTIDRSEMSKRQVISGAEVFNNLLDKKNILCWFHGHTHEGSNNAKINNIQVMNAGALKNDRFMYVELIKEKQKWKLSKKCYQIL